MKPPAKLVGASIAPFPRSLKQGATPLCALFLYASLLYASFCGVDNLQGGQHRLLHDTDYSMMKYNYFRAAPELKAGRGAVGKQAVLGMREREGRVAAKPIDNTGSQTIQAEILNNVEQGATLYTDEHGTYVGLEELYKHEAVKHSAKEFVNHMAHTNGIESVWAVLKRGYNGVNHHWSKKRMRRYVNEFVFRLNEGNLRIIEPLQGRKVMQKINKY